MVVCYPTSSLQAQPDHLDPDQLAMMASLSLTPACTAGLAVQRRMLRQQRSVAPSGRLVPAARRSEVIMASGGPFEELADKLGDDVFADLNGWRLYLRDMKAEGGKTMAQVPAEEVGVALEGVLRSLHRKHWQVLAEEVGSGASVEDAMKKVSISLGGGKKDISLFDVVPSSGVNNAKNAVQDLDL